MVIYSWLLISDLDSKMLSSQNISFRMHSKFLEITQDSDLGICWMIHGSNPGRGKRFASYPKHPHLLWDPPSLLFNGDQGVLSPSWSSKGMRLITHLQLKPWLRMSDATPPLPHMTSLVCVGSILPLVPMLQIFRFFLLIKSAFKGLPQVHGHISLRRIKANHMRKKQPATELFRVTQY